MNKKSPAAPNECGLNSAENTRSHSVPGACRRRQSRHSNLLPQSHIQRKVGGVLVNFTMPCDDSDFDADLLLGSTLRLHLSPRIKWLCYPSSVEITINIPDELAHQVALEGKDPARVALEALAAEGYRTELLSESALRRMLGFQSRMEVHAFLKEHGVYLHYDISDLKRDEETAQRFRSKLQGSGPAGRE